MGHAESMLDSSDQIREGSQIMTEYKARVILQDECPRLGSGLRIVIVQEGRKWLRLTCCASGRRVRLPMAMLAELHPERVEQ